MENSENMELNKILNESAENINNDIAVKAAKKRGPKGPRQPKEKLNETSGTAPILIKYSKDQYANTLTSVFIISGMYLSKSTGFKGFEMSLEEIKELSNQGAEVCDQFLPAIESKWIALGGFTLGLGAVYGLKYMAFVEWRMNEDKKVSIKKETIVKE